MTKYCMQHPESIVENLERWPCSLLLWFCAKTQTPRYKMTRMPCIVQPQSLDSLAALLHLVDHPQVKRVFLQRWWWGLWEKASLGQCMSHDNVRVLPNLLESLVGFCVGNLNVVLQSQWSLYRENSPLGPESIVCDVTVERTEANNVVFFCQTVVMPVSRGHVHHLFHPLHPVRDIWLQLSAAAELCLRLWPVPYPTRDPTLSPPWIHYPNQAIHPWLNIDILHHAQYDNTASGRQYNGCRHFVFFVFLCHILWMCLSSTLVCVELPYIFRRTVSVCMLIKGGTRVAKLFITLSAHW